MKPQISEFSFGYALTEALVNDPAYPVVAAPSFPSLIAEGKAGGGYDVKLAFVSGLLFLQFKLSDCMVMATASECIDGLFAPPFFRMHLSPSDIRTSTNCFATRSCGGASVYAAPKFHTQTDFDQAYLAKDVPARTVFIAPSEIGPLPDEEDHHLAFADPAAVAYFYSETRRKVKVLDGNRPCAKALGVTPNALRNTFVK